MRSRLGLVAVGLLVVGCGIPLDAGPELVEVVVEAPPPPGDEPAPGDLAAVSMYLIRDDALVHVTRDLPSPASVDVILESLLDGVTEPEQRANLRTAIPPGTNTIEVTESRGALQIDLNRAFASVGGDEEVLAVAQIVLTATSIAGVEQVRFLLEGVPTDVPVASGALSDRPVGAGDYESLVTP